MANPDAVGYEAEGYAMVDVTLGGANRLWAPIRGVGNVAMTPSSVDPQTQSVQDPDRGDKIFGGTISNASIEITECLYDGGEIALNFLEGQQNNEVPIKFVISGSAVRHYTSPGAVADTVEVLIAEITGAYQGCRKVTMSAKGAGVVPDATQWADGLQFQRGGEIFTIVDVIDSTNFVIYKPGDSFTAESTIAEVGAVSDDEFTIAQFPQILGDKDNGHLCKVLSAGVSGGNLNDTWKYQVSLQPTGNRIAQKVFVPFGDAALKPTQAS